MKLYHASGETVEFPEIQKGKYGKDFSWGFYCTKDYEQSKRWAKRNRKIPTINIYDFEIKNELQILRFPEMTDAWLDFISYFKSIGLFEV